MGEAHFLSRVTIFSELTFEELEKIAALSIIRTYPKGVYVFYEGEPGDGFYFVKKGKLKLTKLLPDGKEKILHFVQDGDIFAELLLFDGGPFPASAQTMVESQVGVIRNADMEKLLRDNPDISWRILRVLSRRLRQAVEQMRDMAFRDAYGRLAGGLLSLAQEYGVQTPEGLKIDLPLSQQELANLTGTSRETVARILGQWKRDGLLDVRQQHLIIYQIKELERWL